jgi:hypothetical protein
MKGIRLWPIWQAILLSIAVGFSRRGTQRFVEWSTGLALNVEEHTITQSLIGLDRVGDWKALESFAEYGSWDGRFLQWGLARRLGKEPDRLWHGYHVWAGDDTKVHRCSPGVWGTCTFHEYTARSPNRATTVRAHNGVVTGALFEQPGQPALFFPVAGTLYFRKSQMPAPGNGPAIPFRTKCQLLVEQLRQHAKDCPGKHLAVFDGGFALRSVVRPLARPAEPDQPRIDFVTRLRRDAVVHGLPPRQRAKGQRGRMPVWGKRLPPPRPTYRLLEGYPVRGRRARRARRLFKPSRASFPPAGPYRSSASREATSMRGCIRAAWATRRSSRQARGSDRPRSRPASGGTTRLLGETSTRAGGRTSPSRPGRSSPAISRIRQPKALIGTSAVRAHQAARSSAGTSWLKKNSPHTPRVAG